MADEKISVADLAKHVGEEMGVSSWMMLDQEKIQEFAHCTGDHQWIHTDAERAARESPFGGTIAHGYLTLSLIAPTAFELLVARVQVKSVVNYGLDNVRFVNAVKSGKRVRNHIKLAAVEHKGRNVYLVTTDNSIEIEGEKRPALTASALAIFRG
jgi:acyl dehydratase